MGLIPGPVQWVKGSGVAAPAQIHSQAQELPYTSGAAIKVFEKNATFTQNMVWGHGAGGPPLHLQKQLAFPGTQLGLQKWRRQS